MAIFPVKSFFSVRNISFLYKPFIPPAGGHVPLPLIKKGNCSVQNLKILASHILPGNSIPSRQKNPVTAYMA
ncbi:MAG: hypothetical protein JG777_1749 [Clostridia bacterium]|jgi:hypothetical protein|nr:hypothetical protein [Clostridia bacterium]